jgi:hypothetical protein
MQFKGERNTRKVLWPVLVIGIFLIVFPFAISMPSKTSDGQTMLDQFHPIMQPASVHTAANYYYNTFIPLHAVAAEGLQDTPRPRYCVSSGSRRGTSTVAIRRGQPPPGPTRDQRTLKARKKPTLLRAGDNGTLRVGHAGQES